MLSVVRGTATMLRTTLTTVAHGNIARCMITIAGNMSKTSQKPNKTATSRYSSASTRNNASSKSSNGIHQRTTPEDRSNTHPRSREHHPGGGNATGMSSDIPSTSQVDATDSTTTTNAMQLPTALGLNSRAVYSQANSNERRARTHVKVPDGSEDIISTHAGHSNVSRSATRSSLLTAMRSCNYSAAWNIYKAIYAAGYMTPKFTNVSNATDDSTATSSSPSQSSSDQTNEPNLDSKHMNQQQSGSNTRRGRMTEVYQDPAVLQRGDHSRVLWCAVHHEVPEVGNALSQFVYQNIRRSGWTMHITDAKALMWLALRSRDAMRAYYILVSCHHHNVTPDVELLKIAMACFGKTRQQEMVEGCWKDSMNIPGGVADPDAWGILIKSRARCGDHAGAVEAYLLLDKLGYGNNLTAKYALMIAHGYNANGALVAELRAEMPPTLTTMTMEVEAYRRAGDYVSCLKAYSHIKALPIAVPNAAYHLFMMVSNPMDQLRLFYEEGLQKHQRCLTFLTENLLTEGHYAAGLFHLYLMITRHVPLTPLLKKAKEAAGIEVLEKPKGAYTKEEGMSFYTYDPETSEVDWDLLNRYAHHKTRSKLL